ncbi:ethanolamine utilization protein EutC [Acetobacter senegalensis]|uniref:Ethanolamine utilization protein EutC n=1 Tax=Acetobacter senegalensis TaxID=446692 RepID=A0A149TTP6_9PROT|nr:cyclodeaminase [Acetobacter senegalensis]KXV56568.1 ethanolamine utilization protein EutC [Acetobacter senegalensis]
MQILTEPQLRSLIKLDVTLIDAIADGLQALTAGNVVMPDILRLDIPDRGEVDVKTAYVKGVQSFAVKISSGFFGNSALGLPSLSGMMVLLDAETGLTKALLLDNGYLTDIRTAAAGGVAARALSRPDSHIAAIYGAGLQARLQLEALMLVRPITEARIWARRPEQAQATAEWCEKEYGLPVQAYANPAEAAKGADILVTTTPSASPILLQDWLEPGQHVTAMGSDAEFKNELDPAIISHASLYVADSLPQTTRLGELHNALESGLSIDPSRSTELGAVLNGNHSGRRASDEITVADLTGTGVQDTVIATMAYDLWEKTTL